MVRARQRGITAIELLVVVVIMSILAAVALPSFSGALAKQRIRGAASALQISLVSARSEAVRRNQSVTLTPVAGNWNKGWQMTDAGGQVIASRNGFSGLTFSGGATSITYRTSGRVDTAQSFTIGKTGTTCTYTVRIDTGGRPYVSKGTGC